MAAELLRHVPLDSGAMFDAAVERAQTREHPVNHHNPHSLLVHLGEGYPPPKSVSSGSIAVNRVWRVRISTADRALLSPLTTSQRVVCDLPSALKRRVLYGSSLVVFACPGSL